MSNIGKFFSWLAKENSWQVIAGLTYLLICVFDFFVVPTWYGLTRPEIITVMSNMPEHVSDAFKMEYLRILIDNHEPYTLRGGGLFHLSFGAILTGSTLNKVRPKVEDVDIKKKNT